jgi:hypothetical protein
MTLDRLFFSQGLNPRPGNVDMTQMLGVTTFRNPGGPGLGGDSYGENPVEHGIVILALELLSRCGMILRARLRTSPADERCLRLLRSRVHHSSVMWCNVLNLSRVLHV